MMRSFCCAFVMLSLSLTACSKNKCDFKNDAEKQAFKPLADMTHGAFSCSIEGKSAAAGAVVPTSCEIGSKDCVPMMDAVHAAPATVKDVAAAYRAYLEANQWKVEAKDVSSNYASGKAIQGVQLAGKNGDKSLTVKVFPFGDDMVETRTYLAALE